MPAPSESILSMNSTDWRQKFTRSTPKVPLRKAVLDESSFLDGDEDSLLQTHVFREAIHSIPTINVTPLSFFLFFLDQHPVHLPLGIHSPFSMARVAGR